MNAAESAMTRGSRLLATAPRPLRWAVATGATFGMVGGIVGLLVGLSAYLPTALFAVFELGVPLTIVGTLGGLICGTVASVLCSIIRLLGWKPRPDPHHLDMIRASCITAAALGLLASLVWLDWASIRGIPHEMAFDGGWWAVLVGVAAVATSFFSVLVVQHRRRWLRMLPAATALLATLSAVTAATTARNAADAAVDAAFQLSPPRWPGPVSTGFDAGAVIGVGLAALVAVVAVDGLLTSWRTGRKRPRRPVQASGAIVE